MATEMAIDQPRVFKLNVDEYFTTALSATPAELHPFFISFQDLYTRKYMNSFHAERGKTDIY